MEISEYCWYELSSAPEIAKLAPRSVPDQGALLCFRKFITDGGWKGRLENWYTNGIALLFFLCAELIDLRFSPLALSATSPD